MLVKYLEVITKSKMKYILLKTLYRMNVNTLKKEIQNSKISIMEYIEEDSSKKDNKNLNRINSLYQRFYS